MLQGDSLDSLDTSNLLNFQRKFLTVQLNSRPMKNIEWYTNISIEFI